MNLTPRQRRYLRTLAHSRNPVVRTGQRGLTPALLNEIDQALAHHELIKIRLGAATRDARQNMSQEICAATQGSWVQNIGRIAIIYRPARKPVIVLPEDDSSRKTADRAPVAPNP